MGLKDFGFLGPFDGPSSGVCLFHLILSLFQKSILQNQMDPRFRFPGRSEVVEPVTPREVLRERSRGRRTLQLREQAVVAREAAVEQRERVLAAREAIAELL